MKAANFIDSAVAEYVTTHTTAPDDLLLALAEETRKLTGDDAVMQIDPEQGTFLTMLVQLTGARRAVEVGTFTGYSSICIARGLPDDGSLLACDVSDEWTSVARRYWERAGLTGKIELRLGPAADSLRALPREEWIDFAFIDADKAGYPVYYEEILQRLVPGGLIAVDNTLQRGHITDPSHGRNVPAMRAFNDLVAGDARVTTVLLPVSDGVTLIRKS
ncbi:SAM-dependent methyltransferase [Planotetraspora thailandica]|uniref:SAM-dependent methyltransferase n=1 Tax=Planotetraspora thailandica TaxID=487172 RepID=A0A8J3XUR9_9ACTN|nr:O-methyltransferase [Planotetraspora thailandica]GII55732.1 SAM-dependent methyltransferase [Planotetraspora thailandica]